MDTQELKHRVAGFPFWYHRIELPGGVVTPGGAPILKEAYRIPEDLTGKRVLDVGAWDGFWTFEALKRGAAQAVAIDDFSDTLGQFQQVGRNAWETFDLCREALGYTHEQCLRVEMPVYEVTPDRLGRFDVVFFFGTLYHLRHPLLALDCLSAVCESEIYVESAILDDFSPYRGGLGRGCGGGQIVMEFYPDNQYGGNPSNWFVPTLHCLMPLVRAAGFATVEGWKLTEKPTDVRHCRGFVKGSKQAKPPQPEPVPEPTTPTWSVLRQDDNGNRFVIAARLSEAEAQRALAQYEALGHKQTYWVERDGG